MPVSETHVGISVGPKGEAHYLKSDKAGNDIWLLSKNSERWLGPQRRGIWLFDVFPDGRVCFADFPKQRDDNTDKNAVILGPDNAPLVSFHAGYGIEDIQIGPDNRIWFSYFDEGVYSGGLLPSHGLNAFDEEGRVLWKNNQSVISDCYALNVSNEGVWFCAYTDFDLCRVTDEGRVSAYQNAVRGARAFAIHSNRVMFSHQYKEPPETVHLAALSGGIVSKPEQAKLSTCDDVEIPKHGVRMRGGFVHVFAEGNWYRGHLSELQSR